MKRFLFVIAVAAGLAAGLAAQTPPVVAIRAAQVLDGRGGTLRGIVVVRGSKIERVSETQSAVTHDLAGLTLLPGFIDTHVHIGWHFGPDGRYVSGNEAPEIAALY